MSENGKYESSYSPRGGNDKDDYIQLNEIASKYIKDCEAEKERMDEKYPIAAKLIKQEVDKVHHTGRIPSREQYADVYRQKTIKLSQKVYIPVREYPKFNFVGKLLGPSGNSLRRLQDETQCKIVILGRNSMRDRAKEEELRASGEPKYEHLNSHLHVEITAIAPPAEAYARIAYAMSELRKYLTPDKFDDIRQEQLKELMDGPEAEKHRAKIEAAAKYSQQNSRATIPSYGRHSPKAKFYEKPRYPKEDEYSPHHPREHSYEYTTSHYVPKYEEVDPREYEERHSRHHSGNNNKYNNDFPPPRKTYYSTSPGAPRPRGEGPRYNVAPYPPPRK